MTPLLCSAYLPPVSFFSAMAASQQVLIEQYDSYSKQTLRNRCVIASASGPLALTIPTVKSDAPGQQMRDVRISDHGNWRHQHWNALTSAYMNSPFFLYYEDDFRPFYEKKWEFLIDFNTELTELILQLAGMKITLQKTDHYLKVQDMENIIDLRPMIDPHAKAEKQATAKRPADSAKQTDSAKAKPTDSAAAKPATTETALKEQKPYWQVFRQKYGFQSNLSAVDLLFNMGPEFPLYI